MPLIKLQFKPGVNRDQTNYANEGGWWACDKVRFRSGQPEKIGGWMKAITASFIGVCRQMWNWITTYQDNLLALGTDIKVYIEVGGNLFDITPLRTANPTLITPATNNSISTLLGSNLVTVTLPALSPHGASEGQYVVVSGVVPSPGSIGGISTTDINGNHKINAIINANTFNFAVPTVATSTVAAAGGVAITLSFEIEPGYASSVAGYGWGTGVWGGYVPPLPSPVPDGFGRAWGTGTSTPVFQQQRDWWFDNFDNDLVMNIRNGEGYWWERGIIDNPDIALNTKAIRLSDYTFNQATLAIADAPIPPLPFTAAEYRDAVPVQIMELLVSQQDKHLLAFGSVPLLFTDTGEIRPSDPIEFDPMLIRWADQDTPWDWIPDITNTAGDIRLSRGSKIIRALPTRQEILVWTDSTLYALQFLGTSDVFGLQEYADNISIMGPRACISASNVTYWMGKDQFYAYSGRVETLPCTLREHVFHNFNTAQREQVVCGTNEEWHEVWWFYPSLNSPTNDSYVIYNHLEQIWYYGLLGRTAWLDTPLHDWPLACQTEFSAENGWLYHHELGVDADGLPLPSFIQSSDIDLDEGDKYMLIKRMIPDVSFRSSVVQEDLPLPEVIVQMRPRNFPGSAPFPEPSDSQPVVAQATVGLYTEQVFIRARARQMAFKISSENLGTQWQLGYPRIDAKPDGRR